MDKIGINFSDTHPALADRHYNHGCLDRASSTDGRDRGVTGAVAGHSVPCRGACSRDGARQRDPLIRPPDTTPRLFSQHGPPPPRSIKRQHPAPQRHSSGRRRHLLRAVDTSAAKVGHQAAGRSRTVHLVPAAVVDEDGDQNCGDDDDQHADDDAGDGSGREAAVIGRRSWHGAHVQDGRVGNGAPVVSCRVREGEDR